jgi:hypothetical protein
MYEVTMIKKAEFKNLLFDLFELTLSSEQMKVFVEKLFTALSKKILNQEILTNQQNKPSKKDFDMIYFQLLLDLIERDEFLYSWLNSTLFNEHLEMLYEMHLPS